jgi:hypothetical protein
MVRGARGVGVSGVDERADRSLPLALGAEKPAGAPASGIEERGERDASEPGGGVREEGPAVEERPPGP